MENGDPWKPVICGTLGGTFFRNEKKKEKKKKKEKTKQKKKKKKKNQTRKIRKGI